MEREQLRPLLGIAGAILLFIGVFLPIIQVPFLGSVNYFQNGQGDGVILIVLAVISAFIVAGKAYKYLWITGCSSLATLGYTLFSFNSRMSMAQSQIQQDLANNPYADVGGTFLNMVQLQWGWAILVVGAACLIASAALGTEQEHGGYSRVPKGVNHPTGTEPWTCPSCSAANPGTTFECKECGYRLI